MKSGVEAINGGLGWPSPRVGDGGQPHHLGDHSGGRDHLRCPVHGHIGRVPGDDLEKTRERARLSAEMVIDQFVADIEIWSHQRYQATPALAPSGTQELHGIPHLGFPVLSRESKPMSRIRVFQVATGNVGTEMIKRIAHRPDLELAGLHCYTPRRSAATPGDRRRRSHRGHRHRHGRGDHRAHPDVVTFHGVFPTRTST